jgi:5-methylcytosine-specific restriction endonuclease McrA
VHRVHIVHGVGYKSGYIASAAKAALARYPNAEAAMILPRALRALEVTPGMFQTPEHYRAWVAGYPIRTERTRRWRVPRRWRESVMRHCNYRCQGASCATPAATPTIEHIVPVVLGGSNQPSNLTVLCGGCQARSWSRFAPYLKAAA